MKFLADLLQQDMFVAVVSYLSIGLVVLIFFYYRERKWENDLAQYQITETVKIVDDAQKKNNAYPFNRPIDGRSFPVAPPSDEMQVVEGEIIEPIIESRAASIRAPAEKSAVRH